MTTRIKLRRDSDTNWYDVNPVLALGEAGYDITNNKLKIGDGTTAWRSLSYLTDTTTNIGEFVFTDSGLSLPLGNTMTLNTYQDGGNGESSLTLSPTSESNLFAAGTFKLGTSYGSGSEKYWQFGSDGSVRFPDNSIQTTAFTGGRATFDGNLENNTLTQNYSFTRTTFDNISLGASVVVWAGSYDYISSAKLTIQVECTEDGDTTGWHSQVCEAIIASRGYANSAGGPLGDPQMTVYGVVHTSLAPLVTFTVQRNPTTKLIEVVGTTTAAASGNAALRIHSVEMATND